ncbi:MAG: hypothetical protein ACNA8N_03175 [Trueperaceae bacterium]
MAWVVLVTLATLVVATAVAAQAEDGAGRLIERPYTAVIEVFMEGAEFASEVPFSGETSDFDGLCTQSVDVVWRFRTVGLDNVFGRIQGALSLCVRAEWGADADGAPTMTGMHYTDFIGTFDLPDGSTTALAMAFQWEGFDTDTGQLVSATSWATSGDGSGRFAGAALFGTTHCRWYDPEALMAGVEPELCVMQGMIRYDPFAGMGE